MDKIIIMIFSHFFNPTYVCIAIILVHVLMVWSIQNFAKSLHDMVSK